MFKNTILKLSLFRRHLVHGTWYITLLIAAVLAKDPVVLEEENMETMVLLYGTEFNQGRAHVRPIAPAAPPDPSPPGAADPLRILGN